MTKITILTAAYNSPSKLEGVSRSDEGVCGFKNGDKSAINTENGDKSAINSENGDKIAEKVPRKCRVSAEKVYRAILENPKSSNKDLCRLLGLSDRAVRNQIKLLKDDGYYTCWQ